MGVFFVVVVVEEILAIFFILYCYYHNKKEEEKRREKKRCSGSSASASSSDQEVVHFGRSPGFTFGVERRNKMKYDKVDAHHESRGSSLLESFTKLVTLDDEEGVAPLVEKNVNNSPNPLEQIGTIFDAIFFYVLQGSVLQVSRTVGTYMAYEVSQCSDKYYVQKYLDNVFWPFSMKIHLPH